MNGLTDWISDIKSYFTFLAKFIPKNLVNEHRQINPHKPLRKNTFDNLLIIVLNKFTCFR